jgi:hypothetical protein
VFQAAVIGHITIMKKEAAAFGVGILNEIVDPASVE